MRLDVSAYRTCPCFFHLFKVAHLFPGMFMILYILCSACQALVVCNGSGVGLDITWFVPVVKVALNVVCGMDGTRRPLPVLVYVVFPVGICMDMFRQADITAYGTRLLNLFRLSEISGSPPYMFSGIKLFRSVFACRGMPVGGLVKGPLFSSGVYMLFTGRKSHHAA